MKLKVKHEELNAVADVMTKDGDAYDVEIDNILKQISRLRNIWLGVDSVEFCNNFEAYMTNMKNIPIALRNMSKVTKGIDSAYVEKDEAFCNEVRTEVGKHDEPSYD